jgi:hypothetical protein
MDPDGDSRFCFAAILFIVILFAAAVAALLMHLKLKHG